MRQPTSRPQIDMITIGRIVLSRLATAWPPSTAPLAIGSERKRSTAWFLRSLAMRHGHAEGGEHDGLGEDPAHQELPVVAAPGTSMAPPNTKANSSTNMIGWMVASLSASGWRFMWTRPRRAITQVSWSTPRAGGGTVVRPVPVGGGDGGHAS